MLTMICLTISVGAFRLYESRRQSANAKSMHSKLKNILVMGGEKGEEERGKGGETATARDY